MSAIDDYLSDVTEPQRSELERVRKIVQDVVPAGTEEVLGYGMPTFRYRGKSLIHFAAFKNHMSIFPGTIRFTADSPVPEQIIQRIVQDRLAEISAGGGQLPDTGGRRRDS